MLFIHFNGPVPAYCLRLRPGRVLLLLIFFLCFCSFDVYVYCMDGISAYLCAMYWTVWPANGLARIIALY